MKINIKATGIELTGAISNYLESKLTALRKLVGPAEAEVVASIELGKETKHHKHGEVFRSEINLIAHGENFYAVALAEDLYAAIDKMKDEIIGEVKSRRKKKNTLLRRGGRLLKNMFRKFYGQSE